MKLLLSLFLLAIVIPSMYCQVVWNTKYTITASSTDPSILDSETGEFGYGPHIVYANLTSPNVPSQPLFVFLPGTAVQAGGYENVINTAASLGWKAVGLGWNNSHDPAEIGICSSMGYFTEDCQIEFRTASILGGTTTDAANSIAYRLYKLLLYMHSHYPTQGWNAFYTVTDATPANAQSALVWNKMAWGGHSQGGGTSQMIAMMYPIRRVVQIAPSGIITTYTATTYTPVDNYYLFAHMDDTTEYVLDGVASIGPLTQLVSKYGDAVNVDGHETSLGPSHILKTNSSAKACESFACHACVAFDTNLARDDNGVPIFQPVWKYMIGNPVSLQASVAASPSVSPSRTPSRTASPSITPSRTPSASRTPSKTASPSRTPSRTPSPVSPSVTPSHTPNPLPPSPSSSLTPSPSVGFSPSATPSTQPTVTASPDDISGGEKILSWILGGHVFVVALCMMM